MTGADHDLPPRVSDHDGRGARIRILRFIQQHGDVTEIRLLDMGELEVDVMVEGGLRAVAVDEHLPLTLHLLEDIAIELAQDQTIPADHVIGNVLTINLQVAALTEVVDRVTDQFAQMLRLSRRQFELSQLQSGDRALGANGAADELSAALYSFDDWILLGESMAGISRDIFEPGSRDPGGGLHLRFFIERLSGWRGMKPAI